MKIFMLAGIALLAWGTENTPAWTPSTAATRALSCSRDTLAEQSDLTSTEPEFTYFRNLGKTAVTLDSIDIGLDRSRFRTLSLSLLVENEEGDWEKVFYWSEAPGKHWLSRPLVVPARGTLRFFMTRLDRCPRCEGVPPPGKKSMPFRAPVTFHSRAGDEVGFVLEGWYLEPR